MQKSRKNQGLNAEKGLKNVWGMPSYIFAGKTRGGTSGKGSFNICLLLDICGTDR